VRAVGEGWDPGGFGMALLEEEGALLLVVLVLVLVFVVDVDGEYED
jgi:hypothetical protein